jgi:hypothetical protein
MSYKDKTWCASPQCEGKCGRKMSDKDRDLAAALGQDFYISYAYFCGTPEDMPFFEKAKEKVAAEIIKLTGQK